jgi:uncharacterized protein (DUF697 family)
MTSNATTTQTTSDHVSSQDPAESVERVNAAEKIVRKFVLLSMAAGAIPFPIFDVVASVALNLKLIQELSDLYGMDHRETIARNTIGSFATTIGGLMLGSRIGASLSKFFPGAGTKFGILRTVTFFAVSTHISGKILIMHFEAGGSLLDLDPIAMRKHFETEFTASQEAVRRIQEEALAGQTA